MCILVLIPTLLGTLRAFNALLPVPLLYEYLYLYPSTRVLVLSGQRRNMYTRPMT